MLRVFVNVQLEEGLPIYLYGSRPAVLESL
jgi:hypothetical protein